MSRKRKRQKGMTLLEIVIVTVILALAASGLSFSLGALARTNLKGGAGKLRAAVRYAYNRAVTHGTTVRIHFEIPSNSFSIEEAHAPVALARASTYADKNALGHDGKPQSAVNAWMAARARMATPMQPNVGSSPFAAIGGGFASDESGGGKRAGRYQNVSLGRDVEIVELRVPHRPQPVIEGEGAVHFFPGGRTEHAVIQLGDGRSGVFSLEIHPLTGRVKVRSEAYEPRELLDDPEDPDVSEVSGS